MLLWAIVVVGFMSVTSPLSAGIVMNTQIKKDSQGNEIALWLVSEGYTGTLTVATRAFNDANWNYSVVLSQEAISSTTPQLQMNATGNTCVVWEEYSQANATTVLFASLLDSVGSSFTTPQRLTPLNQMTSGLMDVSINASGAICVVWSTIPFTVPGTAVYSLTYTPGSQFSNGSWNSPTLVASISS